MGFWSSTRKVLGHAVDLRADRWLDYEGLKRSTVYILSQTKKLFTPETAHKSESFEEAVDRLDLSPQALSEQSDRYNYIAIFFLITTAALLAYALLTVLLGNWLGAGITFALSLYSLSLAFRFHFWHFQISQRKLGCSVRDWARCIPLIKQFCH